MKKRRIALFFEGAEAGWILDTTINEGMVLLGFEEHALKSNGDVKRIATEQVLDKEDLMMIKNIIDKTLEDMT